MCRYNLLNVNFELELPVNEWEKISSLDVFLLFFCVCDVFLSLGNIADIFTAKIKMKLILLELAI